MATEPKSLPHVVIIGAGFGGLEAAKRLATESIRLTIIDRSNHHLFQPLLYQVACAGLSPADIAMPVRAILRKGKGVEVIMAHVESIDASAKRIHLDHGDMLRYDYLIVATGARHGYFGRAEWERFAPGLKTIDDATEIRRRILLAFEEAEREPNEAERAELLSFVVIGGGPTGVEMAGAIAELSRFALAKDFFRINPTEASIRLIEGSDRLLSAFSEKTSARALKDLRNLGVEVMLGSRVTDMNGDGVFVGEAFIPARTKVWAAGVRASTLAQSLQVPLDDVGRVKVQDDLRIPGHEEVFVIGDLAAAQWHGKDGELVPGMCPGAMQGGRHAAANILRLIKGQKPTPFLFVDKGTMATIGRAKAVVEFAGMEFGGLIAWMVWLLVHIWYLVGFRNRLLVMIQWAWSYFTFRRGARLITGGYKRNIDWMRG